jgi:hypothetical protein
MQQQQRSQVIRKRLTHSWVRMPLGQRWAAYSHPPFAAASACLLGFVCFHACTAGSGVVKFSRHSRDSPDPLHEASCMIPITLRPTDPLSFPFLTQVFVLFSLLLCQLHKRAPTRTIIATRVDPKKVSLVQKRTSAGN